MQAPAEYIIICDGHMKIILQMLFEISGNYQQVFQQ